jgi:hypothetical protein
MITKWYCCSKCNAVAKYETGEGTSTFPRYEFSTHLDYIVSGFDTEQEAREQLEKDRAKLFKNQK